MKSLSRTEPAVKLNAVFVRLSKEAWNLSTQLATSRRRRLQCPPRYEHLVDGLLRQMSLVRVAREKSRDIPGYFRAVVILRVRASALDLFYNSASGYRAQYYGGAALGTAANRNAIDRLLPSITVAVADANKRTCPPDWVETSLRDPHAKLWPHQGLWVRYARKADRNLLVARWVARQADPDKKLRKRAERSMLTPANERLLELKGGFLSSTGSPLGTFKPKRSEDLHELGFT